MHWLPVWLPMPLTSTQTARTGGCQIKSDLLKLRWALLGLNQWPLPCQGSALPLS
jgi:hypothetical protein